MNRDDVLRLAQPPARRALPGLLAGLASAVGAVALLATSAWLITRAAEQPPILFLGMAIVGVRAFALGRAAFRYLERITSHDAAFRALSTLRVGVFERLLPFAPAGLRDTRRGDLLTRLVGDVDRLQDLPLRVVQPLAVSVIVQAASVAVVGAVLPAAGIALAVVLALGLAVGVGATTAIAGRAETRIAPLRARLQDLVLDLVGGLDVLTAFGAVDGRLAAIDRAANDLRRAELRSAAAAGVTTGVVLAGTGAVAGWTVLQGLPGLASGTLDPAWLALAALVPLALVEQATAVPLAVQAWRRVRTSAGRVAGVVPETVPDEIPREPIGADADAVPVAPARGTTLEVRDLVTRWPGADDDALALVSLVVRPGETVVVRGPSGSGKSSLAAALARFLESRGAYELDGRDARSMAPSAVRRIVGLCEQAPHLFDASIRQNLLFAREDATDDELVGVLARVGLADWTAERGGLDARVGDRGGLVSGGQAQRIALARALLADFPVLVLDEPSADVDADRARAVLRDVLTAARDSGRGVLLLTHTDVPGELVDRTIELRVAGDGVRRR
ncbi:ATP-binding cassette subfamily C protein CydC [Clavibacter michiganensis]|uniref:thiol reductant ABC exporter subunit CydC n=1 Tax=Clavibacter michiganensis TaxID=28447 RepID=UPI001AE505AF|nr:thiol reductant ABC exporter subunit CydC [Clavibacter michiganensis]MBP2458235.1 ATP-binding cassette subfamily C protein CydC [Clavibacter michiganensis]MDQ0410806.1 ATP-binding cassette subfamily C protein CydC [Clavibacter michiganensis]